MPITYRTGNDLDLDGVIDLYRSCSLGIRRPLDHRDRVRRMIEHANLVISAWDGGLMVGIARGLTDFSYCTYLSDLAVRESHQRSGIGRELLRLIREAGGPDANSSCSPLRTPWTTTRTSASSDTKAPGSGHRKFDRSAAAPAMSRSGVVASAAGP